MRLHKENTDKYQNYFNTLSSDGKEKSESTKFYPSEDISTISIEKNSFLFQILTSFQTELFKYDSIKNLSDLFIRTVKRIIPVKESAILIYDDLEQNLVGFTDYESNLVLTKLNHYRQEGILNIIFESQKPMILPDLDSYKSEGQHFNYLVFPFKTVEKKQGVLAILSSISANNILHSDKEIINIILNSIISKIQNLRYRVKSNILYEELQTYQAKLSNDFRLSAIGELTDGVVEDILSPMQVILSYVDILQQENPESFELNRIKKQVGKIITSINRVVKFSNLNQKQLEIKPCNLNTVIYDYYNLVKSTLENLNLELVLDFDNNIPSILSHPNYLYQILTNILGLIKAKTKEAGGIVIQTGFKEDEVYLKFVSTALLKPYSNEPVKMRKGVDLTTRIILNLIKKHEGGYKINVQKNSGSTIIITFPLKRKIRR